MTIYYFYTNKSKRYINSHYQSASFFTRINSMVDKRKQIISKKLLKSTAIKKEVD